MNIRLQRTLVTIALVWSVGVLPTAIIAQQSQIVAPKNKYKTSEDITLGNRAASDAERMYPVINDPVVQSYIERVGEKLVAAIPAQFQHSEFDYRFKVVNVSDLNAFALPGGPMYVNRGMIQAAHNEGELAGVMAHELSHVALRHATAQATKQGSVGNQLGMLGMILGGAVLGGQGGAQLGAVGAQAWMTKYSREYESQADALGAQIMATAGYDPHDLANVFQMLAQQGGSRGPQWLSDHPDPGNRYNKINAEAATLKISSNPIKMTRDFERVKSILAGMRPAPSMQQLEEEYQRTGGRGNGGYGNTRGGGNGGYGNGGGGNGGYGNGSGQNDPMSGGRYSRSVQMPSQRTRTYSNTGLSMEVPTNWRELSSSDNQVSFAPEGAYGDQGITRGAMLGVVSTTSRDGYQATQSYIDSLLQSNSYLEQRGSIARTTISGHPGNVVQLSGRSDVTGETEVVTVYTTLLQNGVLVYIATVVPQTESPQYQTAFRTMLNTLRLNN
jgi:Zn-dependent protease with chaperone function